MTTSGRFRLFGMGALAAVGPACAQGGGQPVADKQDPKAPPLALSIELDNSRIPAGTRNVPIRLVVRNRSSGPVELHFRTGQKFDLTLLQAGKPVWTWSHGRYFTQALTYLRLKPGESQTFNAEWHLETDAGQLAAPGRYTLRAILTPHPADPLLSVEREVTVGE